MPADPERGEPGGEDGEPARLSQRAAEIVGQLSTGDWDALGSDWDATMRAKLPPTRLAEVWAQITTSCGALEQIGRPSITSRGPYRICDLPLVFEHGPMRGQLTPPTVSPRAVATRYRSLHSYPTDASTAAGAPLVADAVA